MIKIDDNVQPIRLVAYMTYNKCFDLFGLPFTIFATLRPCRIVKYD